MELFRGKLWVCCFDIVRNHFFTGRQSVCIFRKILKRFHHLHLSSKYTWYFFALFELSGGFNLTDFFYTNYVINSIINLMSYVIIIIFGR